MGKSKAKQAPYFSVCVAVGADPLHAMRYMIFPEGVQASSMVRLAGLLRAKDAQSALHQYLQSAGRESEIKRARLEPSGRAFIAVIRPPKG